MNESTVSNVHEGERENLQSKRSAVDNDNCDYYNHAKTTGANSDGRRYDDGQQADKEDENIQSSSSHQEDDLQTAALRPHKTPFREPKRFLHSSIDLKLRRTVTALADSAQHKPKQNYTSSNSSSPTIPFDVWLENALAAISPTADMILFAGQSPEKLVFLAKLKMEPINQYTIKELNVALDQDEYVTSILCMPIMSTQKTSFGSIDWTTLVIGLSSGYVKFYTEQSICLLSLKFCDEPVTSLKFQTQKNNLNARSQTHFASIIDELLVTYKSVAILTDGIGLYENLRISKEDVTRHGRSSYEPAYNLTNLPAILTCQKWKIDTDYANTQKIFDAELLGTRCATRFDSMRSDSMNSDHVPAKSCSKTLAFVGRDPFLSFASEAKETTTHSYTQIIGALLPFWSKPAPTRVQSHDITQSSNTCLYDKGRVAKSIVASPDKRLAAVTDDFGRVLLIDVTNCLVVRIWKGYRSAQCGWVEVKRNCDEPKPPYASYLVIYAPKRGLLEIWSAQRGPRVAAFNVGKGCRLLYSGFKLLNIRAESATRKATGKQLLIDQSYSSNCYLLNAKSEILFAIEVPYTYSLYKYGDLKSRDHLLIGELTSAVQQDAEVNSISEILHRIALAESIQMAVQRISFNLSPEKVELIMENLIIKTMKNYDNHSGQTMTNDDASIVDLSRRIIKLCAIFADLSASSAELQSSLSTTLPDLNQRLIDEYEEHPQEIDEFAKKLDWPPGEVLRNLSLLALERSLRQESSRNSWPSNLSKPLEWVDFLSCFDLSRKVQLRQIKNNKSQAHSSDTIVGKFSIKLKECNSKFLNEEKVLRTSLFMFGKLSQQFHNSSSAFADSSQTDSKSNQLKQAAKVDGYNYLEPASRLALLVQFWLSTKLCNHWKMWAFLQSYVGLISDELKVIAMAEESDKVLVEIWKQIYQLILESDNIFAAIIATASIKSDTLRMIEDKEKSKQLDKDEEESDGSTSNDKQEAERNLDWECLCIDAERMSMLSQQLEDVFLLNLLLKFSPKEGCLVDSYTYRVLNLSVASILRSGPTIVSELIAQWAAQSEVCLNIFTQSYGAPKNEEDDKIQTSEKISINDEPHLHQKLRRFQPKRNLEDKEEHIKELLHHVKTPFPCSLESDIVLLNCVLEFCRRWTDCTSTSGKVQLLRRAFEGMSLISDADLKHNLASVAYKTFFQRTFERLTKLIETNTTLLSAKNSRNRDLFIRKELNISEDYLEDFVQFCCDLSEFMLETRGSISAPCNDAAEDSAKLLRLDEWWSTSSALVGQKQVAASRRLSIDWSDNRDSDTQLGEQNSLVKAALSTSSNRLLDVNTLIELNRLANIMNLIFKLKLTRPYPLSLIGEESRQLLKFDLLDSPSGGSVEMKPQSGPLRELRHKFARKCLVHIVAKLGEEAIEITEREFDESDGGEAIDIVSNLDAEEQQPQGKKEHFMVSKRRGDSQASKQTATPQTSARPELRDESGGQSTGAVGRAERGVAASEQRQTGSGRANSSLAAATCNDLSEQFCHWNTRDEGNQSMVLFTNLLSLATEWRLDCDELHLELAFELFRCNLDKIGAQICTRVQDRQTLASGLLKIASQRVLVMFGLSPQTSSAHYWRRRIDKWSLFQPNVASWLKGIQNEEMRREIASLSFSDLLKPHLEDVVDRTSSSSEPDDDDDAAETSALSSDFTTYIERLLGLQLFVLPALRQRTKQMLESVTNHLDGQAARLAYDLLQLLDSNLIDKFLLDERRLWSEQTAAVAGGEQGGV